MESVVHEECEFGVAPFDNSNSTGVIRVQLALIAHRKQIFVSSLHPLHIRLNLYCWGKKTDEIREIRSIEVVFRQAEAWLEEHTPHAKMIKTSSTASAVLSLIETGTTEIAAIGGPEVAQVPILAKNIQTEPNVTTFCRIQKAAPPWDRVQFVLVAIEGFDEESGKSLMSLAADYGCAIGANWIVDDHCQHIGIFELKKLRPEARLHEFCSVVERRLAKTSLLGGYSGKSFTHLSLEKFKSL